MLNLLKINESARKGIPVPTLINNTIYQGDNAMINSQVSKSQRVCQVEGRDKTPFAVGYCQKHYAHILRYGYIKERTIYDRNTFIFEENICRIELFNRKCEKIAEAIIDIDDYDLVKGYKWRVSGDGRYVVTHNKEKCLYMHRFIMNAANNQEVDHCDGNGFYNIRPNLRLCAHSQNLSNQRISTKNTSGFKNIYWDKLRNRWVVEIKANKIKHYIGSFVNIEDAKQAAITARQNFHGKFARNS
jgi:hypothetical protein